MNPEEKIVKITSVGKEFCKGIAEGMEWRVEPSEHPEAVQLSIGQVINSLVLHEIENEEFYLKQHISNQEPTTKDWEAQESLYETPSLTVIDVSQKEMLNSTFSVRGYDNEVNFVLTFADTRVVLSGEQIDQCVAEYLK